MKAAWGAGETKCTPARLARRKGWMRACGGGDCKRFRVPRAGADSVRAGMANAPPPPSWPSLDPLVFPGPG